MTDLLQSEGTSAPAEIPAPEAASGLPAYRTDTLSLADGRHIEYYVFNVAAPGAPERQLVGFFHGIIADPRTLEVLYLIAKDLKITIIAPRLPCHGHSSDAVDLGDMVDMLAEFCVRVGLVDAPMFAWSMGAALLLVMADRYPGIASTLLLLAMPTRRAVSTPDLLLRFLGVLADGVISVIVGLIIATSQGHTRGYVEPIVRAGLEGVRLLELLRILKQFPDAPPIVKRLKISVNLMYGAWDMAIRPAESHHQLPKHKFVPLGHCFPLFPGTHEAIAAALGQAIAELAAVNALLAQA